MQQVTPATRFADQWRQRLASAPWNPPELALAVMPGDRVLFVGAHPDDETFAVGATLASLAANGAEVHVVSMTSGEAAYAGTSASLPDLRRTRQREFRGATEALGVRSAQVFDFPDGDLSRVVGDVSAAIDLHARDVSSTHLLTVWWRDPHPDHEAVGWATRDVGVRLGIPVHGFPIWAHHWSDPDDFPSAGAVTVMELAASHRLSRRRAQSEYVSQSNPPTNDVEALLPSWFLRWDVEYAVAAAQ